MVIGTNRCKTDSGLLRAGSHQVSRGSTLKAFQRLPCLIELIGRVISTPTQHVLGSPNLDSLLRLCRDRLFCRLPPSSLPTSSTSVREVPSASLEFPVVPSHSHLCFSESLGVCLVFHTEDTVLVLHMLSRRPSVGGGIGCFHQSSV